MNEFGVSGGVSAEQNRANLRSAERLVRVEMGIDNQDGSAPTLGYEQRTEYVNRLARVIADHRGSFNQATFNTAAIVLEHEYDPLSDVAFNWGEFTNSFTENALSVGGSVASIGEGVKTTLSAAKWLIPLIVIGGLLFIATRRVQKIAG